MLKLPTSVALQIEGSPWNEMQKILHRYFTLTTARSTSSNPEKKVLVSQFEKGKSVSTDNSEELKNLNDKISHLSGLVLQKATQNATDMNKNCTSDRQIPVFNKNDRPGSKCYFCQAEGHFSRDCGLKRMLQNNAWNIVSATGEEIFTSSAGPSNGGRSNAQRPWRGARNGRGGRLQPFWNNSPSRQYADRVGNYSRGRGQVNRFQAYDRSNFSGNNFASNNRNTVSKNE